MPWFLHPPANSPPRWKSRSANTANTSTSTPPSSSVSPLLLPSLLRQRLGYRGLVATDDLDMKAIADRMWGAGEVAETSRELAR